MIIFSQTLKILKNQFKNADTFYLTEIEATDIEKEIKKLNTKKASQNVDILIKIIKENSDIYADILCKNINNSIKSSLFCSCLKTTDITYIYKKGKKDFKGNYRPALSIIDHLSIICSIQVIQKEFI